MVIGVSLLCGCEMTSIEGDEDAVLGLSDQVFPYPGDETGSIRRNMAVIRRGQSRDALVLEAPVNLRAPLGALSSNTRLTAWATPVFNIGDGIQLDVLVATEDGSRLMESRYFDSGRRSEDRAWVPISIPLDLGAESKWLELRVSGGPQGDLVGDWLALADLRFSADDNPR
jgi:hypothetical protein